MLEVFKAIPEAVKDWRKNRDLLYQLVAGISAALVVTSLVNETRPLQSLTAIAHRLNVAAVANWLSTLSLPGLTESSPQVQTITLSIVLFLVAAMIVVPLWRSRRDESYVFGYEPLRLLGSPAASTIWVLLLIAAEQGDIASTLRHWGETAAWVAACTIGALVSAGVLYLVANRHGYGDLIRFLLRPVTAVVYRVGFGVCTTFLAIALAAISLPLSMISWMSGLESDQSRKARYELEQARAERAPHPTGAAVE